MSDPKDVPLLTDVVESPTAPLPPLSEAQLRDMENRIAQRVLEAIQPALAELLEPLTAQVKAQAEAFVRAAVANALERELRQPRPPGA